MTIKLSDVFKTNGLPTHTFVRPSEYGRLITNLHASGRGLVIEGPSGIGKTTAIESALREVGMIDRSTRLSARRKEDIEYINLLPEMREPGVVLVDDFNKLPIEAQRNIADYIKYLADNEIEGAKIIIVGINNAGRSLIQFASDLVNRIDIIPFERNSIEKVEELIKLGEEALNIQIDVSGEITRAANGSFYLAQLLCFEACMAANVMLAGEKRTIALSFEKMRAEAWDRLAQAFREPCARFCRGNRFRRTGRAPYLQMLRWLAESGEWILRIKEAERQHPDMRNSLNEVITKGHLKNLITEDADLSRLLHFDNDSQAIILEDPQFVFFLQNIPWRSFALDLGFTNLDIRRRYDFALSFAGADRDIAESIYRELSARHYEVFYDKNEQARMLANDLEAYLRPIYQSEARFVICLLGLEYPNRIWTKFEQQQFQSRIPDGDVVPILVGDTRLDAFSSLASVSYEVFSRRRDHQYEVEKICDLLDEKMEDT